MTSLFSTTRSVFAALLAAGLIFQLPQDVRAQTAGATAADASGAVSRDGKTSLASIVVDVKTGKVLSQTNATERRYPASTTKLMTAYLAMKAVEVGSVSWDMPVVMTRQAAGEAPSKLGIPPGSVMRLDEAVRALLVKSANDVATAVGQALGKGSTETFVAMMNRTAGLIGMRDTTFVNAHGLPGDGQHSSAKDLAILGMTIRREFPQYKDWFGTEAIVFGGKLMQNGNKLLGRFDGAEGMKTGYICAAGFNLVSAVTRNDRTLVAVVMGANGTIERESLSAELFDAAFKADPDADYTEVTDLPIAGDESPTLDVSDFICSGKGRTARANDRVADRGDRQVVYGSELLHEMGRPPHSVRITLGGATAGPNFPADIALIENYGIPLPHFRPSQPQDAANLLAAAILRESVDEPGNEAEAGDRADPADAAEIVDAAAAPDTPEIEGEAAPGMPIPDFASR
ncbi:D-alanyl-D-alanine carboxypeptidase [Fulvimarina endophytica]|uniref:D-alanyl-D-alanine carboxypeptidase n=1 Tax=Fulvimarina endophytica TaxID=2293836 RepID=A0A371X0W8_9HYPH|nr:D-alanyl-D-alanine carboxypeptidase family protein [Fulvimarina endophytica]RFC62674.1 D-alanyl-D-alanine carboxypeptidase [Fulvimarina endophytica]